MSVLNGHYLIISTDMSQDVISGAPIYRERGIFALLTQFLSYWLCLTPPFRLWS